MLGCADETGIRQLIRSIGREWSGRHVDGMGVMGPWTRDVGLLNTRPWECGRPAAEPAALGWSGG